jgi:hypothetical protein
MLWMVTMVAAQSAEDYKRLRCADRTSGIPTTDYDIRTMCLFPPACGHWISMTAANVNAAFSTSGGALTRTILASGTTLANQKLILTFDPATCMYSLGSPGDPIYIPPVTASSLWMDLEDNLAIATAPYNSQGVRTGVSDISMFYGFAAPSTDTTTDPGVRSTATFSDRDVQLTTSMARTLLTQPGAVYTCNPPYEPDTISPFCKYMDSVTVPAQGGTYAIVCAIKTDLLEVAYQCVAQNSAAMLRAVCVVEVETLESWYAEESNNAANPTQPQTWTNDTAREVAIACATNPSVSTDYFDCRYPLVAAAADNQIGFCDYAPDFTEIWVSCYGNCIHCTSQHGPASPTGGTQCRPVGAEVELTDQAYAIDSYRKGDLYLNCRFMQTKASLIALYQARDDYLAANPGKDTTFSCYDVFLSNSTYQLDTYTGEWVPAGSPLGDPSVLPPQRRLLRVAAPPSDPEGDHWSPSDPHPDAEVDTPGGQGGMDSPPPRYYGLAHHVLHRRSRRAMRVPYPTDRLRTSDHVSWMEGTHVLHPDYEVSNWIPLPSASQLGFIRRTAERSNHLVAPTSHNEEDARHRHAWLRPRPTYHSLMHSPHLSLDHTSLTLGETLQSAHLLHHYQTEAHPLFSHVQRRHSHALAHKAMVQHFRKHQRALHAHRDTRASSNRSSAHRGYAMKHSLIGRVVSRSVWSQRGGRLSLGSRRGGSLSVGGDSPSPSRRLLQTTEVVLEPDPLAAHYAPVCTDLLGSCTNEQLHCTHYDKYYVAGRRNRNTFCSNNLINSCHTPNQTRPLHYTLHCDSGPFSVPHAIQCTYDHTDTQSCMYACSTNTAALVLAAYPIPASTLLDESLDNQVLNGSPYPFRCDYVMHVADDVARRDEGNSYWCVAPRTSVFVFPENRTLDTRHTQICYNTDAGSRNYTMECGMLRVTCVHQPASGTEEPLYTCDGTLLTVQGISSKLTADWHTEDVPVEWLIASSRRNDALGLYTVAQRCVALRTRTLSLAGAAPLQHSYQCVKSADAGYLRLYDDATAVCTVLYDATASIVSGGLAVPLVQCPYSGILINCTFVPIVDAARDIYTGRFVCRTDLDPRSTRNILLTNSFQFAMACTAIDPLLLQSYGVTFARSDGAVRPISTTDSRLAVLSQDACMFIKRNCETPYQDYFGCSQRLAQDSSRNEFCDIASAPEPIEFPVFTCGTQPTHAIFCSNHNTARVGWVRCQNTLPTDWVRSVDVTLDRLENIARSTQVLTMDCSISLGVMRALQFTWLQQNPEYNATTTLSQTDWLAKPDMCEQVRVLCGFHPTTLAVIPVLQQIQSAVGKVVFDLTSDLGQINALAVELIGNAATYLSAAELLFDPNDHPTPTNNTFQCRLPAQYCTDVYCQVSNATVMVNDTFTSQSAFFMTDRPYATPNVSSSHQLAAGQCRPIVPVYNIMCQGVPITCTLGTATSQGLSFSSYRCASTHTSLAQIQNNARDNKFAWPYVSQDGLGCSVDKDMFQAIESPTTLCMALGAQCVAQNGVSCVSGFVATPEAPFCTLRSRDNPGNPMFECSDLAVSCEWDAVNNWMFCTSQPGSQVWTIGSKFAVPRRADGRTGCVITSSTSSLASESNVVRFFQNVEKRCMLLDQLCKVTCAKGYRTFYVNSTTEEGGVGGTVGSFLSPHFCEPTSYNSAMQETYECDGQRITCDYTASNRTRSASIATSTDSAAYVDDTPLLRLLYKADADYGRSHRTWQCHNQSAALATYPDSMLLDCAVSGSMLRYATDSCAAILGGCRINGTLQCLGNYRATNQNPFCTTEIVDMPASDKCDCGVWWSNAITVIPDALDKMMQTGAESAACASRGFLSVGDYLAKCIGDTMASAGVRKRCTDMRDKVFGSSTVVASTPWKQKWCLWNYTMPAAHCAVAPGNRLPLCTVECPEHLLKTTLSNGIVAGQAGAGGQGTTEYCCRDPAACSVIADTRNCVLGKHENNWYDTSASLSLARSAWPDAVCPRNTLSAYTAYPVVTTVSGATTTATSSTGTTTFTSGADLFRSRIQRQAPYWFSATYVTTPESLLATPVVTASPDALQYSQSRDLCYRLPSECFGFSIRGRGVYYLSRHPALPATELRASDPRRAIQLDDESSFHLHRIRKSEEARRATRMVSTTNGASYFVERSYGYACPTTTFDWRDYLTQWPEAMARVEQRMMQHFLDARVSLTFYELIKFSKLGDAIFNVALVDAAKSLCTTETTNQYPECAGSAAALNVSAIEASGATIDYQHAGLSLILDARAISAPTLNEHRYKGIFFVNLIAQDIRDGVPLDEHSAYLANLTVPQLADHFLSPTTPTRFVLRESDLASTACRNTYNVSTAPAYTGLRTETEHTGLRRIPLWGKPDGSTHTRVYLYEEVNLQQLFGNVDSRKTIAEDPYNPLLFRDHDSHVAPYVLLDDTAQLNVDSTTRVGSVDLPSNEVFFIQLSSFAGIYAYLAERDHQLYGHLTRGEVRLGPNRQCRLRTPLWYDFPYVTRAQSRDPQIQASLALQPLCVVPRCPMPISRSYVWNTGTVRNPVAFPDPDPATVAKDWNSIPCGGHGVCTGPRLLLPETGTCECETGVFRTVDSMDQPTLNPVTAQYQTPFSLQNPACSIDIREGCFDAEKNTAGSCANNGMCVTKFEGRTQRAACKCGRFPKNCHVARPRTCERDLLKWENNGFDEAFACNAPRLGCRNSTDYHRPPGAYLRTATYGCEKVRSSSNKAKSTGKCVHDPAAASVNAGWSCSQCNPGYYGNMCQYPSLQGGCFDAADALYRRLTSGGRDQRTTCYWNSEIGQFQIWDWYDAQAANPVLPSSSQIFNVSCRGLICSDRGTCTHPGMNDYGKEVYDNPQDVNNLAILGQSTEISGPKAAFQLQVRLQMQNQTCRCLPGFFGPMCQFRDCPKPCLNGARCINTNTDNPVCECPRSTLWNKVLLTSDAVTCGGVVCANRGTLTKSVSATGVWSWDCACTYPYQWVKPKRYSDPQLICSGTISGGTNIVVRPTVPGSSSGGASGAGSPHAPGSSGSSSSGAGTPHAPSSSSGSDGSFESSSSGLYESSSTGVPNEYEDLNADPYLDAYHPVYDTALPVSIAIVTVCAAVWAHLLPLFFIL